MQPLTLNCFYDTFGLAKDSVYAITSNTSAYFKCLQIVYLKIDEDLFHRKHTDTRIYMYANNGKVWGAVVWWAYL